MAAPRKGKMVEDVELPEEEAVVEEIAEETDEVEEYDSTKMDPEEELFPGGPNFAQINAWKEKFGDIYVTSVTPDKHVVWRTMTRFEYRNLIKNMEQAIASGAVSQAQANLDNEESIAELCVLFPEYSRLNATGELAGVASTISQQVMEASAFVAVEVRQL